jgi:hypothetical protein
VLTTLFALFALAWRFEPTMVVVLFGVLRSVLALNTEKKLKKLRKKRMKKIDECNFEVSPYFCTRNDGFVIAIQKR